MKFIALLRGINVGGHHKIKMADLKNVLEQLGLQNVRTYIQSGNVIFESEEREVTKLREEIEQQLESNFGFAVPVVIRSREELTAIIENCPFPLTGLGESESVQVAFLQAIPSPESVEKFSLYTSVKEEYCVLDRDVYLFFKDGVRNSKLLPQLSKLGVPATVRNWKTINKLAELIAGD